MPFYGGGDLLGALPLHGFSDPCARSVIQQVMLGLRLMHRCGVVNLDLSVENILCTGTVNTDTFRIVLTDFGQAQRLPEPSLQYPAGVVSWFSRRGKEYYYAPEYFVTPAPAILNAIKVDTWQLVI